AVILSLLTNDLMSSFSPPTSSCSSSTLTDGSSRSTSSSSSTSAAESDDVSSSKNNSVLTTSTDYVDVSKHLINDPMSDLLTDTHISNFLAICVDYFNGNEEIKKFRYVNPTFFESPYQIEDVTNFVTDFDPDISVFFIPVCFNTHWVLFVLRPKTWRLEVYNSLEHIIIPSMYRIKVANVCGFLFNRSSKLMGQLIKLPKCLQQMDGISCGVFLCVYIEQIIRFGRICDVVNFNIEEERLRLDWIFFEVQHTQQKPSYWPPFSGQPILLNDKTKESPQRQQRQVEDSKDDESETSEEGYEDVENVIPSSIHYPDCTQSPEVFD
uniref:Ubiquitin-like protease family profile domain-containing protein n=1 Tax=Panagrolaimus sp. ES5 TaxID=591445 RepID=A0AC34FJJ8_9BILA